MAFTIPNTIANGQSGDASKVQQNFDALLSILNTNVILKDGTVAMTQPLSLSGDPVSALQAAPKQYVDNSNPLGSVMLFGGTSAPNSQWLLCRGQAVSRSTYAGLFAVIGTNYGVGNGSTTFNVPNMQGTLPVGFNAQSGQPSGITNQFATAVGERFGNTDATLPSHSHTGVDHLHGIGGVTGNENQAHTHFQNAGYVMRNTANAVDNVNVWAVRVGDGITVTMERFNTNGDWAGGVENQAHNHNLPAATGAADRSLNVGFSGVSAVNANYPPCQSFNFIIKAL